MKKYLIFLIALIFLPFTVYASTYKDVVAPLAGIDSPSKVTIYFFHGQECPHCAEETIFLNELEHTYQDKINIIKYEVWHNPTNENLMNQVKSLLNSKVKGVPFTVIGDTYISGYNTSTADNIKEIVDDYLNSNLDENNANEIIDTETNKNSEEKHETNLPILGKIDMKKVSIPLVSIVLGFLDGFNPCAMWVLLFLINMLFTMKDRKKMWILGLTFLTTSALVYLLAMLGLNIFLSFTATKWVRSLIGVVALIGGFINIRSYIKTKDDGCHIVDSKKRKNYFGKIKKIVANQNFLLALIGIIVLAASVNLVELACSAGFPAIFIELLNINNLSVIEDLMYILLYILFFLIDDLAVFIIAMTTLKLTGISTKYNKASHLVGGILMIIMGILLILKPEWLMFNFK